MANMSYCRFENTANDFDDCLEALVEMVEQGQTLDELSDSERGAAARLAAMCEEFLFNHGQLEERE